VVVPLVLDRSLGDAHIQLDRAHFVTAPVVINSGIEVFPMAMIAANPTAKYRVQRLKRGCVQPRLRNIAQAPWKMWTHRASIATMYAMATGTRSNEANMLS